MATPALHWFFTALLLLPTLYLSLVSAYLLLLCLGALLYRTRRAPGSAPLRAALLIPAHNEEHQLPHILADANALDYPRDCFEVFVIADNCTDATADTAREAGAHALVRVDPTHAGKGQALDWALRTHQDALAAFDVIAMVDADMQIDPAFLREMAESLAVPGVRVVQALNTVAHPERSWRAALGFAAFSVINYLRPAGRCFFGGTAELKGSGMAFHAPLLLAHGWPAHSLAEDAEFSKLLLLDGIRVHFNPRARVTSEVAMQSRQIQVQQQRWEAGKLQVLKQYFPVLLRRAARHPSPAHLDAVLDLLVPPQSIFVLLALATGLAALVVQPLLTLVVLGCLAVNALCIAAAMLLARAPLKVWLYLGAAPLLLLTKLPVYVRLLLNRGPTPWQRTPRNKEIP